MTADKEGSAAGSGTVLTIFNQKGGIGKTTTSVNLAVCLAAGGYRVALIDVDSQSNATTSLGLVGTRAHGAYQLLKGNAVLGELMQATAFPGLWVCRADDDLAGIELELALEDEPHYLLRSSLENGPLPVDIVIIDCPPALGMVPVNALAASDLVLVPVSPEPLARDGLHRAWRHILRVRSRLNPVLAMAGVVLTMTRDLQVHDSLAALLREEIGRRVLPLEIPFDPQVVAASQRDFPVVVFDPFCAATRAYLALAAMMVSAINRPRPLSRRMARTVSGTAPPTAYDADKARETLRRWHDEMLVGEDGETARALPPPDGRGWVGVAEGELRHTAAAVARPLEHSGRGLSAGLAAVFGFLFGGIAGTGAAVLGLALGWFS